MRIGLALSGGAARGIAHVGVLKYLEERNLKPSCVAGTSAGSIVGSLYCSGTTVDQLVKIASTMSWKDLINISFPKKGIIDSTRLLKIIKEHIGEITFNDLDIPLVINAVDLLSGEEIVIEKGPVAEAVQASCAIPGIFTPVKRDKHLLVDGGLLENVPAAHLKCRNVDHVIAVNVSAQWPLKKEPVNIFEILIQSYDIVRRHRDMPAYEHTDTIIEPDLGDIAFHDTSNPGVLIDRGYDAAREALGEVTLVKKRSIFSFLSRKREKAGT